MDERYDDFLAAQSEAEDAAEDAEDALERGGGRRGERPRRPRRRAGGGGRRGRGRGAGHRARRRPTCSPRLAGWRAISVELPSAGQSGLEAQRRGGWPPQPRRRPRTPDRGRPGAGAPTRAAADRPGAAARRRPEPQPDAGPARTRPRPRAPPSGGAQAAIAFARAQLGEPYVWGAAGPGSWDCSGLTMGAWPAGGKALPHYSVAQYEQSTPIAASATCSPATWCSGAPRAARRRSTTWRSTSATGMIIHAPAHRQAGRPRSRMYYWIPPELLRPPVSRPRRRPRPVGSLSAWPPTPPTPGTDRRVRASLRPAGRWTSRADRAARRQVRRGARPGARQPRRARLGPRRRRDDDPRRVPRAGQGRRRRDGGHRPDRHGLPGGVRRRRRHRRLDRGLRDPRLRRPVGAGEGRRAVRAVRRRDPAARHQAAPRRATSPTWSPAS